MDRDRAREPVFDRLPPDLQDVIVEAIAACLLKNAIAELEAERLERERLNLPPQLHQRGA